MLVGGDEYDDNCIVIQSFPTFISTRRFFGVDTLFDFDNVSQLVSALTREDSIIFKLEFRQCRHLNEDLVSQIANCLEHPNCNLKSLVFEEQQSDAQQHRLLTIFTPAIGKARLQKLAINSNFSFGMENNILVSCKQFAEVLKR